MTTTLSIDQTGRFYGYASIFRYPDRVGDIVMPGAFKRSLVTKGSGGIRMLFQHDPKEPLGLWNRISEDGTGLFVEGRLLAGIARPDALRRLVGAGAVDGLSIGFRTERATRDTPNGLRRLWQIDLWEISIVTFPMMEGARIRSVANQTAETGRLQRSLEAAITHLRNS